MTLAARLTKFTAFGVSMALTGTAMAQDVHDRGRADAYAEVLDLPDWTGIWYPDWTALFSGRAAARPQLTRAAQRRLEAYQESIRENGPDQAAQAQCLPPGLPGTMQQPYPIEILFSPGRVTLITEAYEQIRRIYTDGRELPEVPDLFFNGNSVGYWDGDVLVVDTVGLHPQTNLVAGLPHTEASRIHEHIYLMSPDVLVVEMTFFNPDILTQPFTTRVAYKQDNSFPMREYVCAENNRLESGGEGGANIDLDLDQAEDPFAVLDE